MMATLYCVCGCEIRPDELRGHHLRCTKIRRARRRLAPMLIEKLRRARAERHQFEGRWLEQVACFTADLPDEA